MRRTLRLLFCLSWLLLGIVPIANAQPSSAPIFLLIKGDLWSWNEGDTAVRQITHWGHNYRPVISPDGKHVAYLALSEEEVNGLGHSGQSRTDVWALDIASGEITKLDSDSTHLNVVWSPDGSKLAWTEYTDTPIAVAYDFQSNKTYTVIKDLPLQGFYDEPAIDWGDFGFLILNDEWIYGFENFQFYDMNGKLMATLPLADDGFEWNFWEHVHYQGQERLALLSDWQWYLFDPHTTESQGVFDTLQAYSPTQPDTIFDIMPGRLQDPPTGGFTIQQSQITGDPVNIGDSPENFAISPDGQAIAYRTYDNLTLKYDGGVAVVRNGHITKIPIGAGGDTDAFAWGVAWGAVAWRVKPGTTASSRNGLGCLGALPPRLEFGGSGRVIPGNGANNLRDSASQNGLKVGEIPENGVFTIKGGPVCAEGISWWKVEYQDLVGWTAESQDGNYFLEPNG